MTKRDIYICDTYRELLYTLCDLVRTKKPSLIYFLADQATLEPEFIRSVGKALPCVEIIVSRDDHERENYASLPSWMPRILARNIHASLNHGIKRPFGFDLLKAAGERFETAYIHNPGHFTSKVAAGKAAIRVMRESGLNNYSAYKPRGLKSVLRAVSGYNPTQQFFGEERWVDRIEVSTPEKLPERLRSKASKRSLSEAIAALSEDEKAALRSLFPNQLPADLKGKRIALLLTQPLDLEHICSEKEKRKLYADICRGLSRTGLEIFVKNHPRETPFALEGTHSLKKDFPIEAWSLYDDLRIDLGISICSSSLSNNNASYCNHIIQLIAPDRFHAPLFEEEISKGLAALPSKLADAGFPQNRVRDSE